MSKSGMPLTPSSQYVTLISNASLNAFPDNTASNFTTHFDPPLELHGGEYEVALVDIMYPTNWKNIPTGSTKDAFHFFLRKTKIEPNLVTSLENHTDPELFESRLITEEEQIVNLPDGHYETLHDILAYMNKQVSKTFKRTLNDPKGIGLAYSNKNSRKDIFSFQKYHDRVLIHLPENVELTLSQELADLLGFQILKFKGPSASFAYNKVDLNLELGSLFVYLNIVQDRVVGDVRAPLIGLLPVSKKDYGLKLASRYFHVPQYFKLKQNFIDNARCNIRDELGRLVPFQGGQTTLTLHIRRHLP